MKAVFSNNDNTKKVKHFFKIAFINKQDILIVKNYFWIFKKLEKYNNNKLSFKRNLLLNKKIGTEIIFYDTQTMINKYDMFGKMLGYEVYFINNGLNLKEKFTNKNPFTRIEFYENGSIKLLKIKYNIIQYYKKIPIKPFYIGNDFHDYEDSKIKKITICDSFIKFRENGNPEEAEISEKNERLHYKWSPGMFLEVKKVYCFSLCETIEMIKDDLGALSVFIKNNVEKATGVIFE